MFFFLILIYLIQNSNNLVFSVVNNDNTFLKGFYKNIKYIMLSCNIVYSVYCTCNVFTNYKKM